MIYTYVHTYMCIWNTWQVDWYWISIVAHVGKRHQHRKMACSVLSQRRRFMAGEVCSHDHPKFFHFRSSFINIVLSSQYWIYNAAWHQDVTNDVTGLLYLKLLFLGFFALLLYIILCECVWVFLRNFFCAHTHLCKYIYIWYW